MKKIADYFNIRIGWVWFFSSILIILILGIFVRVTFFTFIDSHELAYEYNKQTGEIKTLNRTGYFFVIPFVTVIHGIDTRPMQVRIEANKRVLNAKLVRFRRTTESGAINSEGVIQFVQMHGRNDYKQDGRDGNLTDILKSYAYEDYSGEGNVEIILEKTYKFLDILSAGTNAAPSPIYEKSSNSSSDSLNVKSK